MAVIRKALVLDHQVATIYSFDETDTNKIQVKPTDVHHINHDHLRQKKSHYNGQRVPEDPTYYEEIAEHLQGVNEILIVSHGKGKSFAGLALMKYLGKHHPQVSDNVVGLESLEQLTDNELAAHAQKVFHDVEHRRFLGFD